MNNTEKDISFRDLFLPLTVKKIILILCIVGLVIYFNMLFNGFVWDDLTYIINNPEIKNFNIISLFGQNSFNSSGYFRPIPAVYFSALFNLFGGTAFFYHFMQLTLHIVSTTLLFFILKNFFKKNIAFVLSLLFLIHPINVESVAYIGASQSELLFLFGGLSFLLSVKEKLKIKTIFSIHLLLLLAILTKEVSFLFFVMVYFYRFLFKKGITKQFAITTIATLSVYLMIRFFSLGTLLEKMHLIPISRVPFHERLLHIPAIFFYYIKTFFFPLNLAIDQIWVIKKIDFNNFYFPLLIDFLFFGAITYFLFYLFKNKNKMWRLFAFFLIWYLLGMSMLLQIFPLDMTVADRWFYFPFVGLLGMMGVGFSYFWSYISKHKTFFISSLILVCLMLSARTVIRNANWLNPLVLYSHDLVGYDNYDLENFLAAELVMFNRFDEALPHLQKAVRLLPHDTNLFNLGTVYEHFNKFDEAKKYYKLALDSNDDYSNHSQIRTLASEGWARMTLMHDTPEKGKEVIKERLKEFPKSGTLWAYLAIAEYNLKNQKEAEAAANTSMKFLNNPTTNLLYKKIVNNEPLNLKLR